MTLDSYRNFVTIVDCGSIVAAANKLLIAQPSLSNQLKNIEKTYGAKLLLRGNRSLELTDAGRIFYKRAKEICMMEEGLRNELLNQKAGFSELLKISIPAGNSPYFLHKFFDAFIAKHPKVNYDFYEIPSEFVIPNVLNGITEIGLIRSAAPGHGALTLYPYEKEDIVALFPKDHPLAKIKGKLSVPNLANYPLAIPFDCLDIVYASFGHYLLSPNVSMITSPKTTAIEWARSFGSVALVSLTKEDMREIKDMCIKYISDDFPFITTSQVKQRSHQLFCSYNSFYPRDIIIFYNANAILIFWIVIFTNIILPNQPAIFVFQTCTLTDSIWSHFKCKWRTCFIVDIPFIFLTI